MAVRSGSELVNPARTGHSDVPWSHGKDEAESAGDQPTYRLSAFRSAKL